MSIKYEVNRELLSERIVKRYGSQKAFLKALGITRQAFNYKINASSVSIVSLIEICNVLDISERQFMNYFIKRVG